MGHEFLPTTREEMLSRGWDSVDVVLVTGDAYVDHPSFGVSLIGRWLEHHDYRVAILSQPDHQDNNDFKRFGRPRLFFGITAGNLDSIVANYTGNAKVRDEDGFSPGNNPYFGNTADKNRRRRPDRAVIRYANLAKSAFRDVPVVLGGLEASLRRFIHYDYQQAKLRNSALLDAKANLLVYGMGERAVLEVAERLRDDSNLQNIEGTCERLSDRELASRSFATPPLYLPSWDEIHRDPKKFMAAELAVDQHARSLSRAPILQQQNGMWLLQHPSPPPLTSIELDGLYELPFVRSPHPAAGDVPAYRMIRHSVTIVRGCSGNCSFCAITRHQGPVVTSRSQNSILREIEAITRTDDFTGTISDLGGPTANLFGTSCRIKQCKRHDCLHPEVCKHLEIDESSFLELLARAEKITGVKHVFISSGMRMGLLLKTRQLLERILEYHTPGAMKIAPEHTNAEVLRLMHKENSGLLEEFLTACRELGRQKNKRYNFTPYLISSHPGCTAEQMTVMARKLKQLGLQVRQFQDFTPTPGTLSTAMYVTGVDRDTGNPIHVPRSGSERKAQRRVLEKEMPSP